MLKVLVYIKWIVLFFIIFNLVVPANYKFLHNSSEIERIEIVEVTGKYIDGQDEQVFICSVEDKEALLKDLKELKCSRILGDTTCIQPGDKVVKIIYKNGEYELIGYYGQAKYTKERGYQKHKGRRSFQENDFEAFVMKYIDKAQQDDF